MRRIQMCHVRGDRVRLCPADLLLAVLAVLMLAFGATALLADDGMADIASSEVEAALAKEPNLSGGRRVYLTCAVCHQPEGWGTPDGAYPQIAGQLPSVIIKQLADFRSGQRENALMFPFSAPRILGGPQQMADVAAYIAQLPMAARNGVGPGTDLDRGASLYRDRCARCHGERGEGDGEKRIPALAGQHFLYLRRQADQANRRNCGRLGSEGLGAMRDLIPADQSAVLDFVSRLRAPSQQFADDGWLNPDFPGFLRDALQLPPPPPPLPPIPPLPMTPPLPPQPPELPVLSGGRPTMPGAENR